MLNCISDDGIRREFHVARDARDQYQFDLALFTLSGNVIFPNFHAARIFAQKMNTYRDLINHPERAVRAGQLNAMGLIDEILHLVIAAYREQVNPNILRNALQELYTQVGQEQVDATLYTFSEDFPPLAVYRGEAKLEDYLQSIEGQQSHREVALEEMLMLWLANQNPAFMQFAELFDDQHLEEQTPYSQIFANLQQFLGGQPGLDSTRASNQTLLDILRGPALASPNSLTGQLAYIRENWGMMLDKYILRLLSTLDVIAEEEKIVFPGGGPGPAQVYEFDELEQDIEAFSTDLDWMPKAILIARNAYVWLDQLSKQYGRPISTLAQIPNEELDTLARWGLTGLWLIGLWERSAASKSIKQIMGNEDAVASAYSLYDYQIAADLGGEAAYRDLRDRAWRRGIRLASDMVPNHMGIDAQWVVEHPDWFLALPYSPYPSYSFNGPDLSSDGRVGIFLEDHYYNHTDAAVVFKRVDYATGDTRYIYHGNDGTSMPWNDTAQIDYLNVEAREAVIQTILHVARMFPIIRFDAAMVLAKRHVQRLWFPEPGTGGAIASRADHGMTKAQFDALMPQEFWREVVDRAAVEAPGTLLLAEAFWMLEGYFVRTLGMHRVYNSAFMNMLRDEDNAQYRSVIKNTLEFDSEILKRYVNFMNNPDERTAVEQFGKDDKYFGICTLMVTMPGLPMFGHGQIQGFTEKYGMEYRRAYWDEQPDQWLIGRHEREIFPLLHRRYLFAEVKDFLLYDFFSAEGAVNEDVFAYSNRVGEERSLVIVHNKYATARGWINNSAAYSVKTGNGDERTMVHRTLSEGLGLNPGEDYFCIFRDQASGLEYIRSSHAIANEGMYLELGAYQTHVFLDFREIQDNEHQHYRQLTTSLAGQGVPRIDQALRELLLEPIHSLFRELISPETVARIMSARTLTTEDEIDTSLLDELEATTHKLLGEIKQWSQTDGKETDLAQDLRDEQQAILQICAFPQRFPAKRSTKYNAAIAYLQNNLDGNPAIWAAFQAWLYTHKLGKLIDVQDYEAQSRSVIDEWRLGPVLLDMLHRLGLQEQVARRTLTLIKLLATHQQPFDGTLSAREQARRLLEVLLEDADVQQFLQINRHEGILWFNKEAWDQLLWWLFAISALHFSIDETGAPAKMLVAAYDVVKQLQAAEEKSDYQIEKLRAAL